MNSHNCRVDLNVPLSWLVLSYMCVSTDPPVAWLSAVVQAGTSGRSLCLRNAWRCRSSWFLWMRRCRWASGSRWSHLHCRCFHSAGHAVSFLSPPRRTAALTCGSPDALRETGALPPSPAHLAYLAGPSASTPVTYAGNMLLFIINRFILNSQSFLWKVENNRHWPMILCVRRRGVLILHGDTNIVWFITGPWCTDSTRA